MNQHWCCSVAQLCLTLCNLMDCSTPGFSVLRHHLEFAQSHVHWVSDAIQPSHPLSPLLLPSIFPSIHVFSNELALAIRWPKYWNFNFISPSNDYSGLIFFRIDWFDLFSVQGTHKNQKRQFFGAQLSLWSHSHIHTLEITIALTRWTFVGKVMSLFLICCLSWS